jgi:hypothetical protein
MYVQSHADMPWPMLAHAVAAQTDFKQFDGALSDYNRVLQLMEEDGARLPDGTARYSE